jgi:replicative DNA helicase
LPEKTGHVTYKHKLEVKVILSCLSGNSKVQTALAGKLAQDHFGYRPTRRAWKIIESMMKQSALGIPSLDVFLDHPKLDQATSDLLKNSQENLIVKVDDARRAIEILEHYRKVRRFQEFSKKAETDLEESEVVDVSTITEDMETCLLEMRSDVDEVPFYHVGKGTKSEDSDVLMEEVFSPERPALLPSCFNNFDKFTHGFGATDLFIPASHKKGGKSVITLNMTVNMYRLNNVDVIYIPLEMSKQETAERLVSMISGVEHQKIRQKETSPIDKKLMREKWDEFTNHGIKNKCRFTVWPTAHVSIPQLRLKLKPFKYKVIVIDYINLLQHPDEKLQEWQKLNELARELKLLTKDLNALIIAPTQMNEDGSLRYARGLAEHANTVWTWNYGEEEKGTHIITIDQPAVRGWAPFKFQLLEDFSRMTVTDHLGGDPNFAMASSKPKLPKMKGMR